MKRLSQLLAVLLALSMFAAACGGSDDDSADTGDDTETVDTSDTGDDEATDDEAMDDDAMADHLGDGSLGVVTVEDGAEIQIRSLNAISGDVAFLGVPNQRAVEQAIADYGDIKGFGVSMGTGLDDLCSADGGQAAAQTIVADEQVIGVIGTSCSGAATAAAPLISEAGMVMVSPSNTSPALTSDQQGNAGDNYNVGYYRTAHNDLFQGAAMAEFVYNELGLTTAAAIHDGDPYTEGLASAFTNSFEALGGTVTGFTAVAKEDTDMVPVLTEIAAGSPQALFFPIFQPAGDFLADQAPGVAGLENTQLIAADGLLTDGFLELERSEGMFFSGPDTRFGDNANQSTGVTAAEFLATYEENNGEPPSATFWGHAYDATAMLLDAIDAASWVEDGSLMIDRAGVREFLNNVQGYEGIIGTINCDDFGDCGSQAITIIEHLDSDDIETSKTNVVFAYTPAGSTTEAAVTGGGDDEEAAEAGSAGLVYDIGGRGDLSFNDSAAAGLERAADELGFETVEASPNDDGSNRAELLQLAADSNDIVLAIGFLFAGDAADAATANPDVNFAVIDDAMINFDTGEPVAANAAGLTFAEEQGSFLVGAAAALKSETGKLGFIGGVCCFGLIEKFEAGFRAGALAVNPDIEIVAQYITDAPDFDGFNQPDQAKVIATTMYEDGVDIIYHAAGGAGNGMFAAAKEFSEDSGSKVWGIGVDSDQYNTIGVVDETLQEYVLTSMLKRVDVAVFEILKAQAEGNFAPGNTVYDLSVDGVGYSTTGGFVDDIVDQLDDFKAQIIAGDITVPTDPTEVGG